MNKKKENAMEIPEIVNNLALEWGNTVEYVGIYHNKKLYGVSTISVKGEVLPTVFPERN